VKVLSKAILPALVASVLAGNVLAQEDKNQKCIDMETALPGLYATTDEGRTFLIKDDKIVEMGPGESGFANEGELKCINKPPAFLEWPCATQAAQSRMFNTYTVEDLSQGNKLKEIVQRYFDVPEVLVPIAGYVDGEYNAIFNYNDLIQFSSPEYWYFPSPDRPILSGKRPKTLLVSLFVGTNQVVIDNYMIDLLRKELGTNDLPVAFVFNDSNTVPVSYFGANVSIEEVKKAFFERGIKLAEVPIWWQGDYQLQPTIEEFEKFFDIPPLEDIPADKQAALKADLEEFGFTRKTIIISVFAESRSMAVDQPERIRVAASMGIDRIPTTFNFVEEDMLVARCGPGTPISGATVSGSTTPVGGATVPPGASVIPPAPFNEPVTPPPPPPSDEPNASNS
jgi:hypothetical protein